MLNIIGMCPWYILINPSFEDSSGWHQYWSGFNYTSEDAYEGARSAKVVRPQDNIYSGLLQIIYFSTW